MRGAGSSFAPSEDRGGYLITSAKKKRTTYGKQRKYTNEKMSSTQQTGLYFSSENG